MKMSLVWMSQQVKDWVTYCMVDLCKIRVVENGQSWVVEACCSEALGAEYDQIKCVLTKPCCILSRSCFKLRASGSACVS